MPQTPDAGFSFSHENSKLLAWGSDMESAFEAALAGLLNAAGAPAGNTPGDKTITIESSGKNPAELLDNLVARLAEENSDDQLDGSITMGGIVRSETGWNGWLTAGIDPNRATALNPFEFVKPPLVERKPGRVTVKAQLMVWDDKMLEAMEQLRRIMPPDIHPGGLIGPDPFISRP